MLLLSGIFVPWFLYISLLEIYLTTGLMGTKRPFDEGLQEFIKHPRHIDNGNKPDYFGEDKHSYETSQYGKIAGRAIVE
ncbi:hypothetical protein Tco_1222307 [Tanacetum coccineum]